MTRLSVCGLGVSCNEMNDTPMLLVVADIDDTRSDLDSFIKRHADKLVLPEDRTK